MKSTSTVSLLLGLALARRRLRRLDDDLGAAVPGRHRDVRSRPAARAGAADRRRRSAPRWRPAICWSGARTARCRPRPIRRRRASASRPIRRWSIPTRRASRPRSTPAAPPSTPRSAPRSPQADADATAAQKAAAHAERQHRRRVRRGAGQAAVPRLEVRGAPGGQQQRPGQRVHQRPADAAVGRDAVDRQGRDPVRDARRDGLSRRKRAGPYCANTAVSADQGRQLGQLHAR